MTIKVEIIVEAKGLDDTRKEESRERGAKTSKNRAFGKFLYSWNRSKKLTLRRYNSDA